VTLIRNKVLLHLGASMSVQWVANVIQHMLKLPDSYYQRRHLGDTMSRFASIASIQQ
jgi:ATP-binding cassette subfamily B protein RaxB